jgi:lipopolysaccharide biosynthesis glycosyltransferase
MIRVFIGYDPRESVAWHTLAHSILSRASEPVSITPIALAGLDGLFDRPRDPRQSTDFSFSRFLTPYLSNYEGWSIFMDCDMLVLEDIAGLWNLRDDRHAVQVVKHRHVPKESSKFLGMPQTRYEKKNWSSVMLMNNARCRKLTPHYVNTASGLELHQFKWLHDEELIGPLPHRWNHLVGYDAPRDDIALLHYTAGGPYFDEWKHCDYSELWFEEHRRMQNASQRRSTDRRVAI